MKGKPVRFDFKGKIPYNMIYKVVEDRIGYLWLNGYDIILRVEKEKFRLFAEGKIKSLDYDSFGMGDGLASTDFQGLTKQCMLEAPNGEIWFATNGGVSIVNPEKIFFNKIPPPVVFRDIVFNFDPVSPYEPNRSFKGIKNITFTFTAPTFINPRKARIKFKMEGFDTQWYELKSGEECKAQYKNLPFGEYCFRVIAANNSGIWNTAGASFPFVLKPYFYQTFIFKFAMAILGIGMIALGYFGIRRYIYIKRLKLKYKNSPLDPEKTEKLLKSLLHLMEVEKSYRDEELTLETAAAKLSILPRYLSQVVNERLEKNFRDFINSYRVEEAKKMIINPGKHDYSLLDIAVEVGFNSKDVFTRVFKKYTDMTPSEFKKSKQEELKRK